MILSWRASRHIQTQVEQLLTKSAGAPVSLQFSRFIRYPSVCRLRVQASPIELNGGIIVKKMRRRENPTGAHTSYPAPQWMFFNDWAGLQFLQQEAPGAASSPRLYAAQHEPSLLVIEDLKPLAHLGTYLEGDDTQKAQEALAQWGAAWEGCMPVLLANRPLLTPFAIGLPPVRFPGAGYPPGNARQPPITVWSSLYQ